MSAARRLPANLITRRSGFLVLILIFLSSLSSLPPSHTLSLFCRQSMRAKRPTPTCARGLVPGLSEWRLDDEHRKIWQFVAVSTLWQVATSAFFFFFWNKFDLAERGTSKEASNLLHGQRGGRGTGIKTWNDVVGFHRNTQSSNPNFPVCVCACVSLSGCVWIWVSRCNRTEEFDDHLLIHKLQ